MRGMKRRRRKEIESDEERNGGGEEEFSAIALLELAFGVKSLSFPLPSPLNCSPGVAGRAVLMMEDGVRLRHDLTGQP